jgi:hypothetical protein
VDAVHAKGSYIFLQLWALGRAAYPEVLEKEGKYPYVSASDVLLTGKAVPPRPLTIEGKGSVSYTTHIHAGLMKLLFSFLNLENRDQGVCAVLRHRSVERSARRRI